MHNNRLAAFCLLAFALLILPCSVCAREEAPAREISVKDAAKLIKEKPEDLLILDVRTPAEYREGHIAGARNMDFFGGRFDMDARSLPKNSRILVYCRSGKRSAGACDSLREIGLDNLYHMHEGFDGWKKAGLPVSRDDGQANAAPETAKTAQDGAAAPK